MSFALYVMGYVIFVVGVAIGAHLLHVSPRWIAVGVTILVGLGIVSAVGRTRHKDPPSA